MEGYPTKVDHPHLRPSKPEGSQIMADLKIQVYKTGKKKPETVVTISLKILRFATRLLPQKAMSALKTEGIDLDEIISLAEKEGITGKLVEVEKEGERIVISVE